MRTGVASIVDQQIVRDQRFFPLWRMMTSSFLGTVRLWDVTSRKLLRTFSGHSDDVSAVVHFEPGTQKNRKLFFEISKHVFFLRKVFLPLPARFASACRDRTVRVWDTVTGACVAVWGKQAMTSSWLIMVSVYKEAKGNEERKGRQLRWRRRSDDVIVSHYDIITTRVELMWLMMTSSFEE